MKSHFCRLSLATVLFSLMLTPASADDQATLFNFALELSHLKIDLNDGQQTVDTTTNYAGITSFQLREGKLQPGISLGYTYLSTDNQAVTAGMQLEGFYIRPAIRGVVIDNPHISLTLTGSYLFQRVEDSPEVVPAAIGCRGVMALYPANDAESGRTLWPHRRR